MKPITRKSAYARAYREAKSLPEGFYYSFILVSATKWTIEDVEFISPGHAGDANNHRLLQFCFKPPKKRGRK